MLSFAIISTDRSAKRISLSIHPIHTNRGLTFDQFHQGMTVRGCVKSNEDHGYVCDLGVKGVNGFMPHASLEGGDAPEVGACLDLRVASVNTETRTVILGSGRKEEGATTPAKQSSVLNGNQTIKAVMPNTLVDCVIEGYARNGLLVSFMGLKGAVTISNLPFQSEGWKDHYRKGSGGSIRARIMLVDPKSETLRLTAAQHIVESAEEGLAELPKVGSFIENAQVVRVEEKIGVVLSKSGKDGKDALTIFVHISEMFDGEEEVDDLKLKKAFKVGSTIPKIRATGIYKLENWVKATLKPSTLSAAVVAYGDVQVGRVYRSVPVVKKGEYGLCVGLGKGVLGLLTTLHLPEAKKNIKVGEKIDVRCLTVDPQLRRCAVTGRSALVRSKDAIIASYGDCEPNAISTGFLSKVSSKGIVVTFCNNVFGMCTAPKLAAELGVEDPTVNYKVGAVVRARIVRRTEIEGRGDRVIVSLDLNKSDEVGATPQQGLKVGDVVDKGNLKVISFHPSDAIPHVLLLHSGKNLTVKLPYSSVLDSYSSPSEPSSVEAEALKSLKVGKSLKYHALVYAMDKKYPHYPVVTTRPSLLSSRGDIPRRASELAVGRITSGYVVNLNEKHGAFIRFMDDLTGIVPAKKGGNDLELFKTVEVKVTGLDVKEKKILLKPSKGEKKRLSVIEMQPGEDVGKVQVTDVGAQRVKVKCLEARFNGKAKMRIHFSLYNSNSKQRNAKAAISSSSKRSQKVSSEGEKAIGFSHPFYNLKVGDVIDGVRVATKDEIEGTTYIDFTNLPKLAALDGEAIKVGMCLSGVVSGVVPGSGVVVDVAPGLKGWVAGVELSANVKELNDLERYFEFGSRLDLVVVKAKVPKDGLIQLSCMKFHEYNGEIGGAIKLKDRITPKVGDVVIAKVSDQLEVADRPAVMVELRDGYSARCCITELADEQDWVNMPLR